MVTVVIPCYNASLYIKRCVEAFTAQTISDFKLIFVDDSSTDDTFRILSQCKKDSCLDITIIRNEVNSGPAVSRNKGILATSTKYITFCDCDDWYEPNYLQTMLNLLESNNGDIAFCGYKVVDENGNTEYRPLYIKTGVITRDIVFTLDADSLCMLMVKTEIMKDTLLPNLRNGEDIATVPLLMAKSQTFVVSKECLYNYFRRKGSASQLPTLKVVESLLSSFNYIKEHFQNKNSKELEFLGIKNVLYSTIITLFSIGYKKYYAKNILSEFELNFPEWYKNPYISKLRLYKKIIVTLLYYRCFWGIRLISLMRNIVVK